MKLNNATERVVTLIKKDICNLQAYDKWGDLKKKRTWFRKGKGGGGNYILVCDLFRVLAKYHREDKELLKKELEEMKK